MILASVVGAATLALAAACGGARETDTGRTKVVAAVYPLAFAAEQVGGTSIEVRDLTPVGAEPHDLELGARDIQAIRAADLVVYLGHGFQPALEDALADRTGPSLDVLAGQGAALGQENGLDPHVWLDPRRYARIARAIARELGDPASAEPFVARLEALDAELERGLARCARREIVTSHAAFGYLARRYRLVQVPLTGVAPEVEPSPRDLESLVDLVRAHGATTIFSEPLLPGDLAETVAREADARVAVLDPLEGLTADEGADYLSVMRTNLATLREALGCT